MKGMKIYIGNINEIIEIINNVDNLPRNARRNIHL